LLVARTSYIAVYFSIPHIILSSDLDSTGACDEENTYRKEG